MVSKKDLNSAQLETMRTSRNPTTVVTANGEVLTKEEATVYVKELDFSWQWWFLKIHPQFSRSEKPCEDHGNTYHWTSGQKPHHIKNGKKINCNTANYVPFVVLGPSTSSSTSCSPTSSASSSQDTVATTEHPATERSESMSAADTEIPNKNDDNEELRSELLQDVPDWLQEFKENLVDKSVPPLQYSPSSSHELLLDSRANGVSGKHSIYTHFPKDRNCDICLRTKITRASCRTRTGAVVPTAENFGNLMIADHKVLSEGCESRNNNRYAVVVQD